MRQDGGDADARTPATHKFAGLRAAAMLPGAVRACLARARRLGRGVGQSRRPAAAAAVEPRERFDYAYSADTAMGSAWAAHFVIYAELARHAAPAVPTLDLCCGAGPGTRYLRDALGADILGVDYSEDALRYARDNNAADGVEYVLLDIRSEVRALRGLVESSRIRQVFIVEGIEHVTNHTEIIDALFEEGVERVLVSTPREAEGTAPAGWHVNPITPGRMKEMKERYSLEAHGYCRFVDCSHSAGRDPAEYVTDRVEDGANYIFALEPRRS